MSQYEKMDYDELQGIFLARCEEDGKNPEDILKPNGEKEIQHSLMEIYCLTGDLINNLRGGMCNYAKGIEVIANMNH